MTFTTHSPLWRFSKNAVARVGGWTCGFSVEGEENCPLTGGLLVFSNHLSFLDPPLLGGAFPRPLRYLGKKELFFFPFGILCRTYGAFPIDREGADLSALEEVKKMVDGGEAVVIFPEGTRSLDGCLGRLRGGAIRLALDLSGGPDPVRIIPVGIDGSDGVLPKGRVLPRSHPIKIRIGEAFTLADVIGMGRKARVRASATEKIRTRMKAVLPEKRWPREDRADRLGPGIEEER